MKVASVIRNRDHQAKAKSGNLRGFSQNVVIHSPAVIAGGFTLRCWSGRRIANRIIAPMAKIDGTTNSITSWSWNSWARKVPPRMPTFCAMPSRADTLPRWNLGTWSEMVAMNGARVALAPSCARHQPAVMTGTLCPRAITTKARVITTVPATIQGRRRPNREVVRSESRPNSTLPMTANRAPKPAMIPMAEVCSARGTTACTFSPIPMIAGPSRAMKKTSCAKIRPKTYLLLTFSVGSANQWCSCGLLRSTAPSASRSDGSLP